MKIKFICDYCNKDFYEYAANRRNDKKFCGRKCGYLGRNTKKDEKHPRWIGDNVGYFGLHTWISKRIKLIKCEFCGSNKNLQRANKSHQYKRDLNDWIVLCSKCHFHYDGIDKKIWKDHIKNQNKECFCGRIVKARDLCSLHYNQLNLRERGLISA